MAKAVDLFIVDLFFRANASLNLESQIKKVDGIVSGFEEKLSADGTVLDAPYAVQVKTEEIQVRNFNFPSAT